MYGLLITIGILLSIHLAEIIAQNKKLSPDLIWKVAFRGIFFGLIGARLYHVASEWELYSKNPIAILFIWNGGMGIFGGMIGGILGIYLATPKKYFLKLLDIFASVLPLGQALGRWGNYFNGELLPYAIYESAADILLFLILQTKIRKIRIENKQIVFSNVETTDGLIFAYYLAGYSIIRILLEKYHGAKWVIEKLSITQNWNVANFNITQTIAILILLLSLGLIWKLKESKKL